MVMDTAGQRLRVLRQKRGLNLEDIANFLNCSASTVSRIETDKNKTLSSIDYINKLADFYNVDVAYILEGYQYPKDIQNTTFSAEATPEDIEFWETYNKLTKEQKAEILGYMKYRFLQI